MENKEFIRQRIGIYTDENFDPSVDAQVAEVLRFKFNIHLPQRVTMNESLTSTTNDHEIIGLILQYRTMD